jgi:bifunctional UDP-N-acetylglucosamine pyrophosphorylase/glucosamine-1-phosphate N-acetyltransferase
MLSYVLKTARQLKTQRTLVIIGHQFEKVRETFGQYPVTFVLQQPQLGTGHAVQKTQKELASFRGTVLVLSGDVPLIRASTLTALLEHHRKEKAALSLISTAVEAPRGYGRIIRDPRGGLEKIVEEKDASAAERRIKEINTGIYCFEKEFLFEFLPRLRRKNQQKEYYLTDLVGLARKEKLKVAIALHPESAEVLGINSLRELARSSQILRQEVLNHWMDQGVRILDPATTYIEQAVQIGPDTEIGPFTVLQGKTRIGTHCIIQSHTVIENATVRDGSTIPAFSRITTGNIASR